jgi:hypothetical protein
MVWAARGTSFRQRSGGDAYERPGWFINLEGPYYFDSPVMLAWLRSREAEIRQVRTGLAAAYPGSLYFPFAISDTRPLRAAQTYMVKFPAELVSRVPTLASAARQAILTRVANSDPQEVPHRSGAVLGAEYREADEDATTAGRDPFEVDPSLVDRALRGHATTQNALANFLRSEGLRPRSPQPNEPQFDVAWIAGSYLFVAEVKSLTLAMRNSSYVLVLDKYYGIATCLPTVIADLSPFWPLNGPPPTSDGSPYATSSTCNSCGRHRFRGLN